MMNAKGPARAGLWTALVLALLGCSSTDGGLGTGVEEGSICTPGEPYPCACTDGSTGSQTCTAEGDGLLPCECGGIAPTGTGGFSTGGVSPTGGATGTGAIAGTGAVPSGGAGGTIGTGGAGGAPIGGAGGTVGGAGGTPVTPIGGAGGTVGGAGGTPVGGSGGTPIGGAGGTGGTVGDGTCCSDGDCICRGDVPTGLTSDDGPYATDNYSLGGVGCIYYPTNAEPPFSAVAISDGYLGTGGCGTAQTSGWGPFYASHGIVAMIIETLGSDQPRTRGNKLLDGIAGFKSENQNPASPIFGQLAGRYGTSGFSMGGGGTTFAASDDPTLLSSVALMAWTPTGTGVTVPTLFTCGSSDGLATCSGHTMPAYNEMPSTTPKMVVTVSSGHSGQPSSGGGMQGAWGLAFQKLYLDGDERWRTVLLSGNYDDTNIQ